jgi:hypothetical protein
MAVVYHKITNIRVPDGLRRDLHVLLGMINLYFFGYGTALAGLLQHNSLTNSVIGMFQFFFPASRSLWSILWGIKMILGQ